ncbi:MAG: hypothetical protein A3D24_02410 [Candidatus Blackburnbacteria bacterium RIFCSPHIGHO2_02_FULL_39_13]|uniref:Phosphoglycerate kinase n=1 Tax=Candidatus Blackburnbacteria bacterium RIFCSPLOWO2_01_FULL_40_20 TaxID=1797519 RepID=A0A1G1VAS0_9BACT|nr:MAG: Phosphoglycerate kinase [Microgenomates group bacterium GW2011_GWA2_39_19]OGY07605.1 MAG: hypothetical protein A2694_02770 [Candidatus Blackburnbacteria bacterium RIFCSPHIGHO2_01_FULL_40_17]OGY09534.1 MAG: hypothetical protein A3D24_02410 [Candidatus Blackburnbacteria bacterium RIFCSPHIGHO2_02_FULL_39_13]OGY12548.1 MAG: hypothetical protein A3A77_01080 [Candidatus Blackburnbacteria bacterium RIFCSPLOWO2_01_FULL_40_20]OGY15397.1 MAG: hypothetical protein A3I52_02940 [Candidatus Blackburn
MNLPPLQYLDVKNKRVLLRLDLDVTIDKDTDKDSTGDDFRLRASVTTIKYLIEHECKQIVVLGHKGRPNGLSASLSLRPVGDALMEILKEELGEETVNKGHIFVRENLRFDEGEEKNDINFAKELAKQGDVYINDAFGSSHREQASIVALPEVMQSKSKSKNVAAGFHLVEEVRALSKVLTNPKEPVVFVIGGGKMDKAFLIDKLLDRADWVLVGGVLPQKTKSYCREKDGKACVVAALLGSNKEDITPDSAKNFTEVIKRAGTIVWNGPMGDVDRGYWDGTQIIAESIANSKGYKVVGGGDTIKALKELNLVERMDYVSTGGGAMLQFIAKGDLPGLKALR